MIIIHIENDNVSGLRPTVTGAQGDACWPAAKDGEYERGRTKHSTEWHGFHQSDDGSAEMSFFVR